jgi:hypothetical protein
MFRCEVSSNRQQAPIKPHRRDNIVLIVYILDCTEQVSRFEFGSSGFQSQQMHRLY